MLKVGKGVAADVRGRLPHYSHDWVDGFRSGGRIFAPATYIFFASAIPALAFGEQFTRDTASAITPVQVLAATGLAGVVQAVLGGQPLLIVGVAEPIVLVYTYMWEFVRDKEDLDRGALFLPWAAWVCLWTALILAVMALTNACTYIDRFTRFSGELFGGLIAVLFMQQAIRGVQEQFQRNKEFSEEANVYHWRLVNGLWSLFLAWGLLLTACLSRQARRWRFGTSALRSLLADYGAPLAVLMWTLVSYAVTGTPSGVPRRLPTPNIWESTRFWSTAKDLGKVPGAYVAAALIPALIISILFYFDHSVSAQLAQTPEFNLRKPSAYSYDLLLLAAITAVLGLVGLPPINGVLPQAPMHTKSLATLKREIVGGALRRAAKRAIVSGPTHGETGEGLDKTQQRDAVMARMESSAAKLDSAAVEVLRDARRLKPAGDTDKEAGDNRDEEDKKKDSHAFNIDRDIDQYLPVEVKEQRLSGLIQSLLVVVCLVLTPILRKIPLAVIYGYFAFMAVESLPGSQFWGRLLLLFTDPKRRYMLLEKEHVPYLETVPFRIIAAFTLFQTAYMMGVWCITYFAGVAGLLFPIPIILLIPIRMYIMPKVFPKDALRELDAAEFEEVSPLPHEEAVRASEEAGGGGSVRESAPVDGGHERDELERHFSGYRIKHQVSRGELEKRLRSRSFSDVELRVVTIDPPHANGRDRMHAAAGHSQ
eukprot:jgi/Chlat1/4522/Chrsp29S00334